jgi:hypothetical protein
VEHSLPAAANQKPIPLPVKGAYTAFVAVLVPYYLSFYGPVNFLWICDIVVPRRGKGSASKSSSFDSAGCRASI